MNDFQENDENLSNRILELVELISKHNRLYYELDAPIISDFEYDELFKELKNLKERRKKLYEALVPQGNDPLVKVGGEKTDENLEEFTHPSPMMSLNNVMNEREFLDYVEKTLNYLNMKEDDIPTPAYTVSHKFDGLALEIIYVNGKLSVVSTRGNGFVGERLGFQATKLIQNLEDALVLKNPQEKLPQRLIVRGEAVMMKKDFNALNEKRQSKGLPLFVNPRNAAAGSLRQLHDIDAERKVHFFAYQLENAEEIEKENNCRLDTYPKQIDFLKRLGFDVNEHTLSINSRNEAKNYYQRCLELRSNLSYEIDGVVFRFNGVSLQNLLGSIDRRPRYAVAWKFPPELSQTTLLDVIFQIGRTGILTPVGILKPVNVAGATVRRATLHNADEIKRKDIQIGDVVEVIRSGDVIPKITRVIKDQRSPFVKPIAFPKTCPSCQRLIVSIKESENTFYYCANLLCPDQVHQRLLHFCSKDAMDIEGFDEKLCKEVLEKKLVNSASELYQLKDEDFMKLERMGEKRKSNLKSAIDKSKNTSLSRFIYALGATGIGQKTSSLLAKKFKTIDALLNAVKEDFLDVAGIGDLNAKALEQFFHDKINTKLINDLLSQGVNPQHNEVLRSGPLQGEKILFTGSLSIPRNIAKSHAERLGAEVTTSISSKTTLLIIGEDPGSKLKKAKELGVKIMEEKDFLNLL